MNPETREEFNKRMSEEIEEENMNIIRSRNYDENGRRVETSFDKHCFDSWVESLYEPDLTDVYMNFNDIE